MRRRGIVEGLVLLTLLLLVSPGVAAAKPVRAANGGEATPITLSAERTDGQVHPHTQKPPKHPRPPMQTPSVVGGGQAVTNVAGMPSGGVRQDLSSPELFRDSLDLGFVQINEGLVFSLLVSLCALILAAEAIRRTRRRTRMSKSTASSRASNPEEMGDKIGRLEELLEHLQIRLARLESPRQTTFGSRSSPQPESNSYSPLLRGRSDEEEAFRYERQPSFDARPSVATPSRYDTSDIPAPEEQRSLLVEYHKLIASRLGSLQQFLGSFAVQPIQPTSEAGQFRESRSDEDSYVWAINIADRDDFILILPGKEMIRKWSLLSKAGGSGAEEYLNGAYQLQPDSRGDLSIVKPAVARFDHGRKTFLIERTGDLSGTT